METKEKLISLIRDTQMTKSQLKKDIIYPCMRKRHDIMVVKPMTEELLNGKIPNQLNDEDIIELLQLLGEDIQIQETPETPVVEKESTDDELGDSFFVEENKEDNKQEKPEIKDDILDKYNTMLIENETLRKDNVKKTKAIEELEDKLDKVIHKLDKFEKVMESLKKFNITEIGQYIKIEDDDVNELYRGYLTEGITELNNAHLFKKNGQIIATKSYYKIETKEEEK